MLKNFGISLLLFGLLLVGIDGFRVHEGVGAAPSTEVATEEGGVHAADGGVGLGPTR